MTMLKTTSWTEPWHGNLLPIYVEISRELNSSEIEIIHGFPIQWKQHAKVVNHETDQCWIAQRFCVGYSFGYMSI